MNFDVGDIVSIIMMLATVSTFIVGNIRAGRSKVEKEQEVQSSLREGVVKLNIKLEQICSTTNEIRTDVKAMDNKVIEQGEEIAVIKRDVQTAFKRIDELREQKEDKK